MATPYNNTLDLASIDAFKELYDAYDALAILSGTRDAESRHVSAVLSVLNQALEQRIAFHASPPKVGIRLVE